MKSQNSTVTTKRVLVVKSVPTRRPDSIFGSMAGEFRIVGDIESPIVPLELWEVLGETERKTRKSTRKRR